MGISIIIQEGITNTLIKFGNEILKDCEKEAESREKRIEELETRCTELFLQNNEFAEQLEKEQNKE